MLALNIDYSHSSLVFHTICSDDGNISQIIKEPNRYLLTSYDDSGKILDFPRLIRKSDEELTYAGNPRLLTMENKCQILSSIFETLLPAHDDNAPLSENGTGKQAI